MRRKKVSGLAVYVLIAAGLILSILSPMIPQLIEAGYSQSMYTWIIRPYSVLTGFFPFSLAELIVVGLTGLCVFLAVKAVVNLVKNPKLFWKHLWQSLPKVALALILLYVGFNMMWGLNYSRLSFAELSGLPVQPASVEELEELALALTREANALRKQVSEDDRGVMLLPDGIRDMLGRADLGYQQAAKIYPELGGTYGTPKGVLLSRYWSYTGIGGVYFPFTAEANVNIDVPHFMLPSAATHEMAHQRGFAREDEANFISYLTCTRHPDPDFQYSGTVMALIHTMNALYRHDRDAYGEIRSQYSQGLNRDLKEWQEYWARFEGPVEKVSTRVNDSYLKANRQQDGIHSYGRMIDLLLAEFRRKK